MLNIARPKSSPSTFGPNVQDLLFSENPFRIHHEEFPSFNFPMSPVASAKASSPYAHNYISSTTRSSPNRHAPIPIAPDPVGLRHINALKRMREDEAEFQEYSQRKRKRAPSNAGPVELNEEEQLLLKLKEEENLPWKDIATRFQTELGKSYQVPALQMRFKRLRERMRVWTDVDVSTYFLRFSSLLANGLISELDSSTRTSLRILGKIPVRNHCTKGKWYILDQLCDSGLIDFLDARPWRLGKVATKVLCSQMGRVTSRPLTLPIQPKLSTGPMGLRAL